MTTSFGEYFDKQRARMIKTMQNKNTELHLAWREDYDRRHGLLSDAVKKGIEAKEKIHD